MRYIAKKRPTGRAGVFDTERNRWVFGLYPKFYGTIEDMAYMAPELIASYGACDPYMDEGILLATAIAKAMNESGIDFDSLIG